MEKVIVTGATSFIGRYLVKELLSSYKVIAIVRPNSKKTQLLPQNNKLTILPLDMNEYDKISEIIRDSGDIFVHLAWDGTRGDARNNEEIQKNNLKNSLSALQCASELNVKVFISAGSQAEYGPWKKQYKLDEEQKACPNTEYGKFKLLFYENAKKICDKNGIKFIEPRFFSLYGPGDFDGTMVISTLKKMIKDEECNFTESIQKWDFLYIDDAISGLKLLMNPGVSGGIYNFGYGESLPLKSYIKEMYHLTNSKSQLNFGVIPYPKTGIVNIIPCVKKLKNLGWSPKIDFKTGILRIIKSLE